MTTSFEWSLPRGSIISGKWKQGSYRVERPLGEGANGKVFLVERAKYYYALKLGSDAVDLQSEVNVLQSIYKQKQKRGAAVGQGLFLVDVDDYRAADGKEYPFYVMRYIKGKTLSDYLQAQGKEWFPVVLYNLLGKLAELHEAGWSFGDLKIENVLVADYGRPELVDYGGATAFGKGVRQFTEIYDRGYWNAGSRISDARYDLFSFAVLCLQLQEGRRLAQLSSGLLPQTRTPDELAKLAATSAALKPLSGWLRKALYGEFASAREAAAAWQQWMHKAGAPTKATAPAPRWLKGLFALSAAVLATTIYFLLRTGP
ncbi:serine/threonine protein kinase [Paenibacillus sp. OV219]|uniref:protein kinase domain-containing protein n=1 Tax=Paenibacillus sp. OV219 TaxID=1884377 RepID=UPI0008D24515|nr:serine/threonine protein kinase [Paenibacillus sp. OV219]SEP05446.1 serine/threonine protein kinase [Paenibacillus sp. OV219]